MKNCPETVQISVAEGRYFQIIYFGAEYALGKSKTNKISGFIDFLYSVGHNELFEISQFSKFTTLCSKSVPK